MFKSVVKLSLKHLANDNLIFVIKLQVHLMDLALKVYN